MGENIFQKILTLITNFTSNFISRNFLEKSFNKNIIVINFIYLELYKNHNLIFKVQNQIRIKYHFLDILFFLIV
jgi:hypothetical protein